MEKPIVNQSIKSIDIEKDAEYPSPNVWLNCPASLLYLWTGPINDPTNQRRAERKVYRVAELTLNNNLLGRYAKEYREEIPVIKGNYKTKDDREYEIHLEENGWYPIYDFFISAYLYDVKDLISRYADRNSKILVCEEIAFDLKGLQIKAKVPFAIISKEYIVVCDIHPNTPPAMRFPRDDTKLLYAYGLAKIYGERPTIIIARSQVMMRFLMNTKYEKEEFLKWSQDKEHKAQEIKNNSFVCRPDKKICNFCSGKYRCQKSTYA